MPVIFPVEIWGTVGQWVGSILSAGSLLLAINILRINQKDKRREQASMVMFTHRISLNADTELPSMARGKIFNSSDAPITDVAVGIKLKRKVLKQQYWRRYVLENQLAPYPVLQELAAEYDEFATLGPRERNEYIRRIEVPVREQDILVVVQFRDAGGRVWDRDSTGELSEIKLMSPLVKRIKYPIAWAIDKLSRKKDGDRYSVTLVHGNPST